MSNVLQSHFLNELTYVGFERLDVRSSLYVAEKEFLADLVHGRHYLL